MKTKIVDINGTEKGAKDLPNQFHEPIRLDLIQRDVLSIQGEKRQAYGVSPEAGMRHVVGVSRRRRDYKTTYGPGISRVPRKIMSRNGTRMSWVGTAMPGTVGGRAGTPPTAERIFTQKINVSEKRKAVRSAMAATMISDLIKKRGHLIPKDFPFILDNKVESVAKTKDVEKILEKLGFENELKRTSKSKVRSGSGKNRGRKYHNKIGPLFVVSKECSLSKSARNIPGVDVVDAKNINSELLAPGCHPGRLTLWSEAAIDALKEQKLFMEDYQGPKQIKEEKKTEIKTVKKAAKTVKKTAKKPVKAKSE